MLKAEKVIPLGSQTFSKSKTALPRGVSLFLQKSERKQILYIDGNTLDFVNGLASVTLGYVDPDVDKAVKEQLKKGVTFSLSHPIETKLAKMIIELIPCADMVRFAKNRSDDSASIRLARAYTGREHIAVQVIMDGMIGIGSTTRDLGVITEGKTKLINLSLTT